MVKEGFGDRKIELHFIVFLYSVHLLLELKYIMYIYLIILELVCL